MAFPDEFMPEIFLQEIKKHSKNVTMKVSYCPGFAQSGPIVWERDKALGSSAISYESGEIYAKGTGFKSLLSILKIFINSRGNISYLKKEKDELEMYKLKLSETEKKYELSLQKESSYKKCIKSFKDTMRQLWQSNDSLIKIIDDYKSLQKSEEIEYTIKNCALFYFSKLRHFLAK